eukprot:scaffold36300_cov123-Isochrysis_galbana.AAC.4
MASMQARKSELTPWGKVAKMACVRVGCAAHVDGCTDWGQRVWGGCRAWGAKAQTPSTNFRSAALARVERGILTDASLAKRQCVGATTRVWKWYMAPRLKDVLAWPLPDAEAESSFVSTSAHRWSCSLR